MSETLKEKWLEIGKKLASFQVRILFTTVYYIIIVPYSIFYKLFNKDPSPGWKKTKKVQDSIKRARRQF